MAWDDRVRARAGFVAATASLVAIFAASASAIPLYELYRRQDQLTHADPATTAVAYFIATQRAGMTGFLLAVVVVLVALGRGATVPFIAATAVAGVAMGAAFGTMRALLRTAGPAERAGLLSAIYLISYSGAALANFIAGQLSSSVSLFHIALGYGGLAALACAITLVAARAPRPTTA